MSDNNVTDVLKEVLTNSYDRGYAKGRIDAIHALLVSMQAVYDMGILTNEEKKGYKICLETTDAALQFLRSDNEENGR